jgi:hypothetical protein
MLSTDQRRRKIAKGKKSQLGNAAAEGKKRDLRREDH